MEIWQGLILLLSLACLLLIGVPVGFSLGLVSLLGLFLFWGGTAAFSVLGATSFSSVRVFLLAAVPLFMLMAEFIMYTGIARDALRVLDKWLGRLPGGLAITTTAVCTVFGAVTGFAPATVAAVGSIAIPEMLERGYDKKLAVGAVGGGAALAILIPPSGLMIIYGSLAEVSVGKLFFAGILPGLVSSLLFMIYIIIKAVRNPRFAPIMQQKVQWRERLTSIPSILPVMMIIFLVLGVIYLGIATPTEAAALGVLGAFCLATFNRTLSWLNFQAALERTARLTCMIFLIIIAAGAFSQVISYLQIPTRLAEFVVAQQASRWTILASIMLMCIILGMFLDAASIIIIVVPIILPITTALGFDPMWFGILIMINMEIATLTPPVGLNLFVLKGVAEQQVSLGEIIRGVTPFITLHACTLLLVVIFPPLVFWLPGMMR